jgi:hypothetical protein
MCSPISSYILNNEFIPHPFGNYSLYGLNTIGCDSVILYNNKIRKFFAFQAGSREAIYVDKDGHAIIINPYDRSLQITRMLNKKDLDEFVNC